MIQLPTHIHPTQEVLDKLAIYQAEIQGTFHEKKALAKSKFSSRNKKGNATFDKIKEYLTVICSGSKRCAYCEDSVADEVEHIYPKDLFPDKCFDWNNYLYACGSYNGPKNNQFAIFRTDNEAFEVLENDIEPPIGEAVLINPRTENGMSFCRLNLITFHFEIIAAQDTKEYQRADYTFNTVLKLNIQRENLREAREIAYSMYKARLFYYCQNKEQLSQNQLNRIITQLKKGHHITVWKEMQRAYYEGRLVYLDNELNDLFIQCPEALAW